MNPHPSKKEIDLLADGSHPDAEPEGALEHVRSCPSCRMHWERVLAFHHRLFSLPREPASPVLAQRILRELNRLQKQQRLWRRLQLAALGGGLIGLLLLLVQDGGPIGLILQSFVPPDLVEIYDSTMALLFTPVQTGIEFILDAIRGITQLQDQYTIGIATGLILLLTAAMFEAADLLFNRDSVSRPVHLAGR